MLYHMYEYTHAAISPMRSMAKMNLRVLRDPFNPFSASLPARTMAAGVDMFLSSTARYGKPDFAITSVEIDGKTASVIEENVVEKPFCNLLHFRREGAAARPDAAVLIVAPMSGHFATLLRGTVEAMLPTHDVYITDWIDARDVPLSEGRFGLDDYIDYVREFCAVLYKLKSERPAVMAVCQPGVPVLAATALMAEDHEPHRPSSVTLMGSPIDTTRSPTEPNVLATTKPLSWFKEKVIVTVPFPNLGFMRRVYPGFLQLSGFVSMNLDRHVDAHVDHFQHLVEGDGDSVEAHRAFYDEYMAVMDMTEEFYIETIDVVFQRHCLPRGEMMYRGSRAIRPSKIEDVGLMTVEGEKDDITGRGQTAAAHGLCTNLPGAKKFHWEQPGVGHYGVFNGSRFRANIQPRIADFIAENRDGAASADAGNAKAKLRVVGEDKTSESAKADPLADAGSPKASKRPAAKPAAAG